MPGVAFELDLDAERHGPMVLVRKARLSIAEATLDLSARLPEFPSLDDSILHFEIVGDRCEQFREASICPVPRQARIRWHSI